MLQNIYNQSITILNRLKSEDTTDKTDKWFKTVVHDAAWYPQSTRTANVSGVYIGSFIKVLLPFHEEYKDYVDWKVEDAQEGFFTMSSGDIIVLGEVSEDVNPKTINTIKKKYGDNACTVKHYRRTHDRFNAHVQLYIEGV